MSRFCFICPSGGNLLRRLPIMKALVERGEQVFALAPEDEFTKTVKKAKITCLTIGMERGGQNLIADFRSIGSLAKAIQGIAPDLVHTFTVKPNIFGTIAAKKAGVRHIVNSVTGLGSMYIEGSGTTVTSAKRAVISCLYRYAMRRSSRVVFQNRDDLKEFVDRKIVRKNKTCLIRGSGVDTEKFQPVSKERKGQLRLHLGLSDSATIICSTSRLLIDKGMFELLNAASLLKQRHSSAIETVLVGFTDFANPSFIPESSLQKAIDSGDILYYGKRSDIDAFLGASDIYCLPSYREGLPVSVLEAMAMGMPVVTTDVPGCREAVTHELNGLLVPVRTSKELADALERLGIDGSLRHQFGAAARKSAVEEFSLRIVTAQYLQLYQQLLLGCL